MRWVAALALVACSAPPRAADSRRPIATPTTAPAPLAPIPTLHAKRDVVESPHGGRIVTLAMTPDGSSVLSADELGGVRLWPALDGSAEPRIVSMPHAKQLAINRTVTGYVAVARDEVGGLYIASLDETGRQLSHSTLPAEPAITGMAMSTLGLVAWRADQTVVLLDADGTLRGKLGTEPQQRVIALAVNGKRAAVVLEKEGAKRQARWLTLEPKLAWGAWIDLETELAGSIDIALAPNGKRIALHMMTEKLGTSVIFDLATGKPIADGHFNDINAEVGFVDDDHVVVGGFQGVAWIELTQAKPTLGPIKPAPRASTSPGLAAGHGHAVTAMNGDLAIWTRDTQKFLGYETVAPRIAEIGPAGQLLVGVGEHMVLLDKDLRSQAALPTFAGIMGVVAEVRWVGDDDWLLESSNPHDGNLQIALITPQTPNGKSTAVRTGIKEAQIIDYEPSTDLVTLSFGAETEIARLDRKNRRLERLAGFKKKSPYEQVLFVPVSPALARGTQLVQITMKERSTIKWLRDPAAPDRAAAAVTVEGPFAGADRAGNVFMWRNTPTGQLELVVYADGKPVRTLPNTGAIALWPEPSGKRYLELAQSTVTMYDQGGKQLWFEQLATSQEAFWLTDGAVAITSAGGVARLDPATGAVTAARCGWRFGLSDKPHPATPNVEPLCSQLRR
jgi:hypothetical protein